MHGKKTDQQQKNIILINIDKRERKESNQLTNNYWKIGDVSSD
jgi:hypothetical protein